MAGQEQVDAAILELLETRIRADLGTLKDLPPAVANTVANVYFRYIELLVEAQAGGSPGDLTSIFQKRARSADDFVAALIDRKKDVAHYLSAVKHIPLMISAIREIDPVQQPNTHRAATDYFLDLFKYRIENAETKIGLWRMIERRFKKVDEIPGLAVFLDI